MTDFLTPDQVDRAVALLKGGGVLIYPTETLYGLGCLATDRTAVERVRAIKGRVQGKPLPLVIGDFSQLSQVSISADMGPSDLARAFWPGPLTLVLPALEGLPAGIVGADGAVAVRLSSHGLVWRLCLGLDAPLVSTSANFAGQLPAACTEELDPELLALTDAVLCGPPEPTGGPPSTIVRPLPDRRFELLRQGAVPVSCLEAAGFQCAV